MPFDPIDFLERAVRTPSHESVDDMRDLLVAELDSHGVDATVDDAGNVLASRSPDADDGDDGSHVVLNTHIDTVSPHVPFDRSGDAIRGRGSCDAKGPLAALLAAFLAAEPGKGRVTLAITPDEEKLSTGAAALDFSAVERRSSGRGSEIRADAVIVGEPTGLDVCNAAKGRFEATIELGGENAHAAEPAKGTNAVAAAAPVIEALDAFDAGREVHPDLGSATLTPTVVAGGGATNQVPADCRITVDRRSVPPETSEGFRSELEAHLRERVTSGVSVEVALADRPTPFLEAFETPADSRLVRTLRGASGGAVRPFAAATEASYFAPAPTVVFGPGSLVDDEGPVAHADREYVPIGEVEAAARAVEETLADYLG